MKNINQKNIITVAVVVGIAVACFIAYQGIVAIPQERIQSFETQQRLDRVAERLAVEEKQRQYDLCVANAYTAYSKGWDDKCKIEGLEADCTLMSYQYDIIEERHNVAKKDCLTRFK